MNIKTNNLVDKVLHVALEY